MLGFKNNIVSVNGVGKAHKRINNIIGDMIDLAFCGVNAVGKSDFHNDRAVRLNHLSFKHKIDIVKMQASYRAADCKIRALML